MPIRINVHPRPKSNDWDLHIPYHGNSYDQKDHVRDSYLKKFVDRIPTSEKIILVNDGEPESRQVAVKMILSRCYTSISIDSKSPCYKNLDSLFRGRHFCTIPRPQDLFDQDVVEYYLENYLRMTKFSHRYDYGSHSRDHGYFSAVKRFWYQFGDEMPVAPDVFHSMIYEKFRSVFETLVNTLADLPLALSKEHIRKNLMLRLNHNPSDSETDGYLTPRHADNSIVTIWLYQNYPGARIDQGQETPVNETSIDNLHDSKKELIVFPGFDYCDQQQTMTSATWHSVINHDNIERASLVAFLKY